MIINLTQMRIWEMNPHLPKPTPNTMPAVFLCAGSCPALVPRCRSARTGKQALQTGMPPAHPCGQGTASPWQCLQALLQQETPHPGAPGSLLGQEASAGAHRAELLASGLQAAWSSTDADSITGPSGAAEKGRGWHRHPCRQLSEAVLETADGLFSWQSQQERQGGPAPTCGRINQQTQVNYLALHINTSVGYTWRGTKL